MSRMLLIVAVIAVAWSASTAAQTTDDAWRAEFDRGKLAYLDGRIVDAHNIWFPLAESGTCKAQFALARIFKDIVLSRSDLAPEQVNELLSHIDERGLRLGFPHYYTMPEDSMARSTYAAIYWYQRAAMSGHPDAPLIVGRMMEEEFLTFHGVEWPESSKLLARFWFTIAAERGDDIAAFQLALSYGTRDPEAATYWLLITEREHTGKPVTGRALNGVETLISPDTFANLKEQTNEWEPRSPLDSAPADCL